MMLFLASLREFLARSFFFLEEAASDWIMLLRSLFDFSFFRLSFQAFFATLERFSLSFSFLFLSLSFLRTAISFFFFSRILLLSVAMSCLTVFINSSYSGSLTSGSKSLQYSQRNFLPCSSTQTSPSFLYLSQSIQFVPLFCSFN